MRPWDAVNELAKLEGRADAVLEQARAVVADSPPAHPTRRPG